MRQKYNSRYRPKSYKIKHRTKKRKNILFSKSFWIFVLILALFCGAIYFFIFSDTFKIKEVRISGNEKISKDLIDSLIREKMDEKILFLKTNNILIFNSNKTERAILENYPESREVAIKKDFSSTLIVNVKERSAVAVFCLARQNFSEKNFGGQEENCFSVDETGIIFEENKNNQNAVIKYGEKFDNKKEIGLGKLVIEEEIIKLILNVNNQLKNNIKIDPKEFILQNDKRIDVKTKEEWSIYFNLAEDIDWQITKLGLVLEKEIPQEKRSNLEYIDLRVGNFAPYKYRE